jgi:hypothetical protein
VYFTSKKCIVSSKICRISTLFLSLSDQLPSLSDRRKGSFRGVDGTLALKDSKREREKGTAAAAAAAAAAAGAPSDVMSTARAQLWLYSSLRNV